MIRTHRLARTSSRATSSTSAGMSPMAGPGSARRWRTSRWYSDAGALTRPPGWKVKVRLVVVGSAGGSKRKPSTALRTSTRRGSGQSARSMAPVGAPSGPTSTRTTHRVGSAGG